MTDKIYNRPFSQENLNWIFRIKGNRVVTRESSTIEFKESFNWGNRYTYAKNFAAFGNNKGGYLIFGIKDKPHEIVGLKNDKFENFDNAKISGFINDCFSPEIVWDKIIYDLNGKNVGLIYIHESEDKPILCKKNHGDLIEGDVYFRYNARTERIKFGELRKLLDFEKEKYKKTLLEQLSKIIQIGVGNVAIMDTIDGKIYGKKTTIVIDETLIPKIRFINEGSFDEIKGEPTLKLVGNVEGVKIVTSVKSTL